MTEYLTDNEKEECKKIVNAIVEMHLKKIQDRMYIYGDSFEVALEITLRDIQND